MRHRYRILLLVVSVAVSLSVSPTAVAEPAGTSYEVTNAYLTGTQWFDDHGRFTGRVPADGDLSKIGITPSQDKSAQAMTHTEAQSFAKERGLAYGRSSERFTSNGSEVMQDEPITPEECRENADVSAQPSGWTKNHFSYCHLGTYTAIQRQCIGPVCLPIGVFQARITLIGVAYNGTRSVDFRVVLDQITVSGTAWQGQFSYVIDCAGAPQSTSCQPNTTSETQTTIEWIATPEAELTFYSDAEIPLPENGEQIATGVVLGKGRFTFPQRPPTEASGPETGIRFDSAWYLSTPEGSIFNRTIPWISYSKSDAQVDETAAHIEQAQLDPASTKPTVSGKHIPGGSELDTLRRLFHDNVRRNQNREQFAIPVCEAEWPGYPSRGQDCDEYPFSSTYEGAARHLYEGVPYGMFSAKALDSADNQEAGNRLGVFYGYDRIIDGDEFYVRIVS